MQNTPALLEHFKIWKKIEFDAKVIEMANGVPSVGLFLNVHTRREITAPLEALKQAGIDLRGLYVVRRNPQPGQRRLVGRIDALKGNDVELSDAYDECRVISANDVFLEGSTKAFARCLRFLLGRRYEEFEAKRDALEARMLVGPALDSQLVKVGEMLAKKSPLDLGGGLTCTIAGRLQPENTNDYQSIIAAPPVAYCFDAAKTKRDPYSWRGLEKFGPYSRDTFSKKSPTIAVFFPDTEQGKVEHFLRQFRDGIALPGPLRYGRASAYEAGFGKTFGLTNPQFPLCRIPWLDNDTRAAAQIYRQAAEDFIAEGKLPDAAFVIILDEHANLPDDDNPYLQTKAVLLMAGIPVQEIKVTTLMQQPSAMQYTCQTLAVSLYAKMNGTPWTVDHDLAINDEIVIGMGTCELSGSRFETRQRFVGITTVFRGDGNYLLSNVSRECRYEDYPSSLSERKIRHTLSYCNRRNSLGLVSLGMPTNCATG